MTLIERIEILESIRDIRELYVDSGEMTEKQFQRYVEGDPTKTKKYVEKMCIWSDAEMSFEKYIDLFQVYHRLVSRKLTPRTDIYSFKKFEDFENFVNENRHLTSKSEEKEKIKSNETEVILDNERWYIVSPKTHSASCIFGAGTKWCITKRNDSSDWDEYSISSIIHYFCIDKFEPKSSPMHKFAVSVYPDGRKECFNAENKYFDFDVVVNLGLSRSIFKVSQNAMLKLIKSWFDHGFIIDADGFYHTDGNVSIINWKGDKLPIRFKRVEGSFLCYRLGLKSLVGCPEYVGKNFVCSQNKLTSLLYSPKYVGWNYDCSENKLTSLKGITQKIPDDLNISFNNLTNLRYLPTYIGNNLYCSENDFSSNIERPDGIKNKFITK